MFTTTPLNDQPSNRFISNEIMGLRAARDAGIKVEKETVDMAIKYVRRCQNPDGGFSYVAGQGSGSGFARSAAGVASGLGGPRTAAMQAAAVIVALPAWGYVT